jgi:hypothetical protein
MLATPRSTIVFALLLAAPALPSGRAEGAESNCDRRVLPRNDTLSAEAAARTAIGSKSDDVHVTEACIVGTTTHVTLTTPRGPLLCERLQGTWSKRGGWKCDTPAPRHD